ncbi:MAG: hypothetical protein ACRDVL_06235 [Acidimicrobiia bacterium]
MRWQVGLVAIGLVLSSCTAPSDTATTVEETRPGRLAVIDGDGSVVVMHGDGSNRVEIAKTDTEDPRVYAQPIWSPDGSLLSWAQMTSTGFAYVIQPADGGPPTEISMSAFPFYAYWSPTGEQIGLLRNGENEVVLELADVAAGRSSIVDADVPYYFSWSPTGDELIAHAGANRLVSRDADGTQTVQRSTGSGYLAPQWVADGVIHINEDQLVLTDADGGSATLARVTGLTIFVANSQGTRVALQSLAQDGAVAAALSQASTVPTNSAQVLDIATAELTQVTDRPAAGLFWSPDGNSLLVLGTDESGSSLTASVWDGETMQDYVDYVPSSVQVRDLFPFFPQYAQSLSFWSADSSAFVLVGEIEDESGVWVQTLGEPEPAMVSSGSWAAWSP